MAYDVKRFIKRIREDGSFYMENFLKIRTKEGQLASFKMNEAQRKSERLIQQKQKQGKPVRVIWLKARQLGISTFCEGKIFHSTANNQFVNSLIIAHEDKATQNLFNMSKLFYDELPPTIKPMKKYSNESALTFENPTNDDLEKYKNPGLRSKITVATARNVQTARSNTYHNIHCSEVAFWDDAETLMTGLLQCVPNSPNSMVFIESTANGIGGWFYDFWKKSERGETDYIPIFLAWFDNPEYTKPFESKAERQQFIDEVNKVNLDDKGREIHTEEWYLRDTFKLTYEQLNWRKWCIANNCFGNIDTFHQEYPSTPDEAFIASGRPQFPVNILKNYQKNILQPIMRGYLNQDDNGQVNFVNDSKGYVHIWKKPEPEKFYVIGGDVAEGLVSGDYSVGIVLDENFDLCAAWHGHIDPDLFTDELIKLGLMYNEAYIGVESNNHGLTTIRGLQRKEYWNLYYQKSYDKIQDTMSQKVGWNTNKRTKPLMINTLTEYIREQWLGAFWDVFISECFTYVKAEDGTTNAQQGSHDDTIMAMAIALMLLLEGRGENYQPEVPRDQGVRYVGFEENYDGVEELCIDNSEDEEYSI